MKVSMYVKGDTEMAALAIEVQYDTVGIGLPLEVTATELKSLNVSEESAKLVLALLAHKFLEMQKKLEKKQGEKP